MTNPINLSGSAKKIIAEFLDKISSIEPTIVEGIYITGSLSLNDFHSNKSDIDFVVLCNRLPDQKIVTQLKHIHKTIAVHNSKPDLSGIYLTIESLQTGDTEKIKNLTYHKGTMNYATFDMAPIILSELKMNAITVCGPIAKTLPININKSELNNFLHRNINSYWTKWINQHSTFNRKLLLLLFPSLTEWSVLGVARQLCTLQTGKIVSKTEAGIYCLQQMPEKFHPILKDAIEIRKDNRRYPLGKSYVIKPSIKRYIQTIDCVRYIISTFNKMYNDAS